MFKQVYWITFWLLFLKLNSQVSIQLESIVIESSSISDSSTYNFISTNNGLQHYQLKLSKYNLSNSAPSFRNLFCSVPALHVIEHDASGLQLSIASRGLNPNRSWEINMKQDGGDLSADPLGYPEAYYTPPLQSIEQIEIYRGSASLQHGTQFGGALNFISKKAPQHKPYFYSITHDAGFYNTQSTFAEFSIRKNKWSLYQYLQYKSSLGWKPNSVYISKSAGIHAEYIPNKHNSIELSVGLLNNCIQQSGGMLDADLIKFRDTSYRARNWMIIPWHRLLAAHKYQHKKYTLSTCIFSSIGNRNSIGYTASLLYPDSLNPITGHALPRQADEDSYKNIGLEHRININGFNFLNFDLQSGIRSFYGTTQRNQLGRGDAEQPAQYRVDLNSWKRSLVLQTLQNAFFTELIFKPLNRLTCIPGFRLEHLVSKVDGFVLKGSAKELIRITGNRNILLFGFRTEYKTVTNLNWFASINQSYRPYLFSDLYSVQSMERVVLPVLDSKGFQTELGLKDLILHPINVELDVFYTDYPNRMGLYVKGDSTLKMNLRNSKIYGSSLVLQYQKALVNLGRNPIYFKCSNALSYTYGYYLAYFNGTSWLKKAELEYNPRWIEKIVFEMEYAKWHFKWMYCYSSAVFSDASNTLVPSQNAQSGLIPGYGLHDLNIKYCPNNRFILQCAVTNLLNRLYFTRRANAYPGPGIVPGAPRLWTLSITFTG